MDDRFSQQGPDGTRIIFRAIVGSTIHGTSVAQQDDRDEMQLGVEPPDYVIGLRQWETTVTRTQPEGARSGPGDLDLVTHSLRKFARLALGGNPTIQMLLFVPPLFADWQARDVLYHRDWFLSRRAGKAFLGYMESQRQRLSGESGCRHGRPRQELIEQYGFDTKYAGHIVRLGFQGIELMTTGRMTLPMRQAERERVVAIRTGKVPLAEVLEQGAAMEAELAGLLDTSPLPDEPNADAVNELLRNTYLRTWQEAGFESSQGGKHE